MSTIAAILAVASASGINAYAALLVLGLCVRFELVGLDSPVALFFAEPWVLAVLGALYTVEFAADKIPAVDHVWDAIHTFIRPAAGAAAAVALAGGSGEGWVILAAVLGGSTSLLFHGAKSAGRVAVNAGSMGMLGWVVSLVEDAVAIAGALLGLLLPLAALLLFALISLAAILLLLRVRRGAARSHAAAVVLLLLLSGGSDLPAAPQGAAERLLVAPVSARSSLSEDPFVLAIPALLSEGISGEGTDVVSLVHDLPPEVLDALGAPEGGLPDARLLGKPASVQVLRERGSVRMILFPRAASRKIEKQRGYEIEVGWMRLDDGSEGVFQESSLPGEAAVDAVGRLAAAALRAWREARGEAAPLSARLSTSAGALGSWASAGLSWKTGDPPAAIRSLEDALRTDPDFDRARVDLAWIRLAQGRRDDAGALVGRALAGKRLAAAAVEESFLIRAAAAGDGKALIALADSLDQGSPGSPRAPIARAFGHILLEDYPPAIGFLDLPRFHRPNDPALLHLAGIAGLGAADYFEARERLSRAALLWPTHEVIASDLAEAHAREHDFEGARAILDPWSARFDPAEPPGGGESWSVENPPPPVRVASVHMLEGHPRAAAEALESRLAALEAARAPVAARIPVLYALHELQMWLLDDGPPRERQQMLVDARESLRLLLDEWVPQEERARRPWIYDRLVARLRTREGRIDEAREIHERIKAASGLPGYDPGVEAEIEAVITLKLGETEAHLAACRRGIEARGSLLDHYMLLQAYTMMRDWRALEEEYQIVHRRLADWSAARREDALLSGPMTSGHVPLVFYSGALARFNQGDGNGARERFEAFLSYYREPDSLFRVLMETARGGTAAAAGS